MHPPPPWRRRVGALLAAAALGALGLLASPSAAHAATASFTPGQVWKDTSGNALQLHGLGIVESGSAWYGFGEDKAGENSGDTSFQDIACYRTTDLAHWTYQGQALSRQSSGDLGPHRIVERPKVLYNAVTRTYVMYTHIDNSSYSERKVGVATSSTPCGPYTYRGSFQPLGHMSLDMSLFQDTDGTGYLLTEDRANGLRIDKLSADYLGVASAVNLLPGANGSGDDYEAPAMVHVGSRYYLLGSHLSGWATNDNVYSSTTSLSLDPAQWAPFRPFAPAGTRTYDSQSANIIPVQGGFGTTYIYAGDRWNTSDLGNSPPVWLPMTISGTTVAVGWQNSWSLDTTAGTWSGGSPHPAAGSAYLTNANSGKVLDVADESTADGGKVIQWQSHNGANQQWALKQVSGGVWTLTNAHSGKCLDVSGASTATNATLDQSSCVAGAISQQWALTATGDYTAAGDTAYTLVNMGSGWTADVSGGSTGDGAPVIQWTATGGANQTWNLTPAS
ncbi:RICIN domain-containing protein [Streptomyces sp. NPDC051976]|uniref:RICIN domain-containing protein n=1 Tax=Streptomyces sp. NPDC051976 TaxID=3154947 RepID=UPI00343E9C30